jgi:hypothetical protein
MNSTLRAAGKKDGIAKTPSLALQACKSVLTPATETMHTHKPEAPAKAVNLKPQTAMANRFRLLIHCFRPL